MLTKTSLKFLEEFMNSSSPSGFEEEAAACFRNYLAPCCDEVKTDVLGNTMAVLNPGAPMRVMLAGHYDEIGFQIVYISDEGLLYFRPNGGIDKLNVPSTEVDILTASGRVRGVIGKKPIHLLKPAEREVPPELSDMWIDIGAENRAEAEKIVSVGDPVAVGDPIADVGDNTTMTVEIPFHSADAAGLYVGQTGTLTIEGTMETVTGTIESISGADEVGAGGALIRQVKFRVSNPGGLTGTTAATAAHTTHEEYPQGD